MRTWRLLLIGFGTVGRGTVERLHDAADELRQHGCDPMICAIVDPRVGSVFHPVGLDPERVLGLAADGRSLAQYPGGEPVEDALEAIAQLDVDVVLEMTPTNLQTGQPALEHVLTALTAGRHVITSNKGPVALAGERIQRRATAAGVQFRCEGTVMSGTPVLSVAERGLAGAGVRAVRGILNGTCNFMLTQMEQGASYEEALLQAQQLGYAEADPTGDVQGWDAAAKVTILAQRVVGAELTLPQVAREGIVGLDGERVRDAVQRGRRWRLVASLGREGGTWRGRVGPVELESSDPLCRVQGAGNLVVFETEALGPVSIAGPGAGRRATGHAMVADLLAIHAAESGP